MCNYSNEPAGGWVVCWVNSVKFGVEEQVQVNFFRTVVLVREKDEMAWHGTEMVMGDAWGAKGASPITRVQRLLFKVKIKLHYTVLKTVLFITWAYKDNAPSIPYKTMHSRTVAHNMLLHIWCFIINTFLWLKYPGHAVHVFAHCAFMVYKALWHKV